MKTESFRDTPGIINKDGGRKWIYATQPAGKFYNYRTLLTIVYLLILFGLPFVEWNGNSLFLFDIPSRKIILFGVTFTPQDFFLFMLTAVSFLVFVILFTVVFGRIFCGWLCPQTIFMEMIFRRIEYWIEGTAEAQKRLNNSPWTSEKYLKKISKHIIFWSLSFVIANFFLAYIIGIKALWKIITEPVSMHIAGLSMIIVFTTIFYSVFAFFREMACVVVCPYGRLQSVLLDKNSIVVAYDYVRGEPRGKIKKNQEVSTRGDCVDCGLCVKVCPTGIDIRNGTQMECVNCTACIDVCNSIMRKLNKPEGLIRYASEESIKGNQKSLITPRVKFYSVILFAIFSVTTYFMLSKSDIDVLVMRSQGLLFQEQPNNKISNLYTVKVQNKVDASRVIRLEVENGQVRWVNGNLDTLSGGQEVSRVAFIEFDRSLITKPKTEIYIRVLENQKEIKKIKTTFFGPY